MRQLNDLRGHVSGRLQVLYRVEKDKYGKWLWLCQCDCGQRSIVLGKRLVSGHTRSCGCLQRDVTAQRSTIHGHDSRQGMSGTIRSYKAAKQRCTYPRHVGWKHYGGRGIEFRFKSFEEWYAELGDRPEGMTVDRKNSDGHYEPGNVRWATDEEQANNKRDTHNVD